MFTPHTVRSAAASVRRPFLACSLDRRLAQGRAPDETPALRRRAAHITSPAGRAQTACELTHLLDRPRPRLGSCALTARLDEVDANRPLIEALVRRLREQRTVAPRGVALARELLIDGDGPLYADHGPGALADALSDALVHLGRER
jgi:hypothetical protein